MYFSLSYFLLPGVWSPAAANHQVQGIRKYSVYPVYGVLCKLQLPLRHLELVVPFVSHL